MSVVCKVNSIYSQTDLGRCIRDDFPLLNDTGAGKRLHYLDSAATSQKPQQVIDAISDCYRNQYAPVHRGFYALAEQSTAKYELARERVAKFIGAPQPDQLVFTRSATESINMVAQGWLRSKLKPGDKVWVSGMEHHSNFLPWQQVCQATGAQLCFIELKADGTLDVDAADGLFDLSTRLIAVSHISNVLGVINPIADLIERASQKEIPVLVDATQSVGHIPVDVSALNCDFLVFSAHKMFGPSGIGALFAQPKRLQEMEPLLFGGGMVDEVDDRASSWATYPARFEAGSPNLAGAIGFASAVDYIEHIGLSTMLAVVEELTEKVMEALLPIRGLEIYGPQVADQRAGIVSFNLQGIHPHDVAQVAGDMGVAIRSGHHCCQPLMRRLGVTGTVRASFAPYNLVEDVDALVESVLAAQATFAIN